MADRPLISDMRSRPGNQLRGSMISPETLGALKPPEKAPAEPQKEDPRITDQSSSEPSTANPGDPAPATDEDLSPAESFRKRLKLAKIELSEASGIYDAVLDKGYYEEYVRIRNHRAVFRTRSYEEQLRLATALELLRPQSPLAQEEIIQRYNLAASLFEWEGKALKHDTDDDFENALKLIKRLPAPLVGLLYSSLARFDHKVMLVFSEGATDSF